MAADPPTSDPDSSTNPSSDPSTGPRGPSRTGLYVAVAAVVVVAALLLGLGYAGVIPGFHLRPNPGGPANPTAPSRYSESFTQSGLPTGTTWAVTFNGTTNRSSSASIGFNETAGTYTYTIGSVRGFTVAPSGGSVTLPGAVDTVAVTFTAVALRPGNYSVDFVETGLPPTTNWSVTFAGSPGSSTSGSIGFAEPNGSYGYTVGAVPGYSPAPPSGTVNVHGADQSVPIAFSKIVPGTYAVSFTETGLALGTQWTVTLNGTPQSSTGASIGFTEPNGSYNYTVGSVTGYTVTPVNGTLGVHGGSASVGVTFSPLTIGSSDEFAVTFNQTGLAGNISWGVFVSLNSSTNPAFFDQFGEGSTQVMALPNGSYDWTEYITGQGPSLPPNATLTVGPYNGTVDVAGDPAFVTLTFGVVLRTAAHFPVTFTETGLPSGGTWFVTLNGTNRSGATGTALGFTEPNGTFSFNLSASDAAYFASQSGGTFEVLGHPVTIKIVFTREYALWFNETGIPFGVGWTVSVNSTTYFTTLTSYYPNPALDVTNGTYDYSVTAFGYNASPVSGSVVVNGHPTGVSLTFTPTPTYNVWVNETGLPSGTAWDGTVSSGATGVFSLNSLGTVTNAPAMNFSLPNGSYSWMAYTLNGGFLADPMSGAFTVQGSVVNIGVTFSAAPAADHLVVFSEYEYSSAGPGGPTNGSVWKVSLNGVTESTTGPYVTFAVPNGTYVYSVEAPGGYTAIPGSGSVYVNSSAPTAVFSPAAEVDVAFSWSSLIHLRTAGGPAGSYPLEVPVSSSIHVELVAVTALRPSS